MKVRVWPALLGLCLFVAAGRGLADSPAGHGAWVTAEHSAARLVARTSALAGRGPVLVGLHIRLDEGWHTYWRTPGDAGLPPMLDFAGSRNLARHEIFWPAPRRARENGLETFVYYDEVVLPVAVEAADRRVPLRLRLELLYGVCREICIPEQASLELELAAAGSRLTPTAAAPLIEHYLARVPAPASKRGLVLEKWASGELLALGSERPLEAPFAIVEYPGVFARALDPVALSADRRSVSFALAGGRQVSGPPPLLLLIDGDRAAELTLR